MLLKQRIEGHLDGSVGEASDSCFGSDHDLRVSGSSPTLGFSLSGEWALDSLLLSFPHKIKINLLKKNPSIEKMEMDGRGAWLTRELKDCFPTHRATRMYSDSCLSTFQVTT